jgi:putative nucleotidyltransferase with HDIG domain
MSKILVVEDDPFFREVICDLLKKKSYNVFEAATGKAAQEILILDNFDLVISDIQMPGLTGIELLKWANVHKKNTPYILMTGFSMLLETQTAYEMGAKEFIANPFKQSELLELILKVDNKKAAIEPPPVKIEYSKVSIEEFVARPKIDFDVYIKLTESRYTRIANNGDVLDRDRLAHYKSKGVKYLYLTQEDFAKLISLNLNISRIIKDRGDISNEKKLNFMKYTGQVILEKAFSKDIDRSSFVEAESFLKITNDVLTDSPSHLDLLLILNEHAEHVYAHSVGVSLFAVMIAKNLGFESNLALNKISMAAMFHDIGKKEIEAEILRKPRHALSSNERKIYESHSTRGKDILLSLKSTPADVIQIVHEHHEDISGQGFPLGRAKKVLHPLSKIIHCANLFVEQAMPDLNNPGCSGRQAIATIETAYEGRIDLDCLNALKKLYKII